MSRSRVQLARAALGVALVATLALPSLAAADVIQPGAPARRTPRPTPAPSATATAAAKPAATPVQPSPTLSPTQVVGASAALVVFVGVSAGGLVVLRRRGKAKGSGSPGA